NGGRGGGRLGQGDPAAERPGIAVACEAEIFVVGSGGSRAIPAADFFLGPLTTALEPDEIVVELRLPPWPARRRWGFQEFARRRGDFALAGAAAFFDQDASGKATNAHVGVIGVGDVPQRLSDVEAVLNGHVVDEETIARAEEGTADSPQPAHHIP